MLAWILRRAPVTDLGQIEGNFAFCAIDESNGKLIAGRDHLGGRPLYLFSDHRRDILGNRAAEVYRQSGLRFRADPEFLAAYFAGDSSTHNGVTPFAGVRLIEAGEIIHCLGTKLVSRRQPWSMRPQHDYSDPDQSVQAFHQILQQSVEDTLPASGSCAIMLSGGMDSAPIAIIANQALKQSSDHLQLISWTLDAYPGANERRWIEKAHTVLGRSGHLFDGSKLIPMSQLSLDQVSDEGPWFNPYRPLINHCYQIAAQQQCGVILNGNAGDELYPPFHLLYQGWLRERKVRPIAADLMSNLRGGFRQVWNHPPLRHLAARMTGHKQKGPPDWLTLRARQHWKKTETWPPECLEHPVPEYAAQLLGTRMTTGRAREQVFPAHFGIERRDPFHNQSLVEFMLHAPFDLSVRNGRTKWIMREAMKNRMPDDLRLKRRTGLMGSFYQEGLKANQDHIRHLLFKQSTEWQEWIEPSSIDDALNGSTSMPAGIIASCIGFSLWLQHWK